MEADKYIGENKGTFFARVEGEIYAGGNIKDQDSVYDGKIWAQVAREERVSRRA